MGDFSKSLQFRQLGDLQRQLIDFQKNGNLSKQEIRRLMSAAQKQLLNVRLQIEQAFHNVDMSMSRSANKDTQSMFYDTKQTGDKNFASYTDHKP
jgi:trehalose/maltose hydrolase-like predicted phosphorylase